MRWFLENAADDSCVQPDVERPKKRRKVSRDDSHDERQSLHTNDEEIPIYKVTLDLHFPESLGSKPVDELAMKEDDGFEDVKSIPIIPYGIEDEKGNFKLRLTTPGPQNAVVMVEVDELSIAVREALQHVTLPGRFKKTYENRRDQVNPATTFRCALKQRLTPKQIADERYTVVRLEVLISWRSGVSAFPAGMPLGSARVYEDYEHLIESVALIPSDGGRFEVNVNGELVFSKLQAKRHAEAGEVVNLIHKMVEG